jgi:hypothetical protein
MTVTTTQWVDFNKFLVGLRKAGEDWTANAGQRFLDFFGLPEDPELAAEPVFYKALGLARKRYVSAEGNPQLGKANPERDRVLRENLNTRVIK